MTRAAMKPKLCSYCDTELDRYERRNPRRDEARAVMCDDCFSQHYEDNCTRCCELFEKKTELASKPGHLIGVWREVPALTTGALPPGYYRVLKWPIFADGMIEGYFFGDAVTFACGLDAQGERRAEEEQYMSGPICRCCSAAVEEQIGRLDGVSPTGDLEQRK